MRQTGNKGSGLRRKEGCQRTIQLGKKRAGEEGTARDVGEGREGASAAARDSISQTNNRFGNSKDGEGERVRERENQSN